MLFVVCFSAAFGLALALHRSQEALAIPPRALAAGLTAMFAFGVFEQWPGRLPAWLPRWVLQVVGVTLAIPLTTATIYVLSNHLWHVRQSWGSLLAITVFGMLLAPWAALGALIRQKETLARHQALAFELEKSELEREALDARLHLLQAQVAPHFLFNTLANVQALVDAGSPKASEVLRSLIAYLRAAVPRIQESATTLGREVELVRAYLELMHMRMPDRLQFALFVDDAALDLRCPPLTLLTLVENAVRHGIDPSEEGGRIEVHVRRRGDRCLVRVTDSGVGLATPSSSLGTGLSTLRERLRLVYGEDATLELGAMGSGGVTAEIVLPVRTEESPS